MYAYVPRRYEAARASTAWVLSSGCDKVGSSLPLEEGRPVHRRPRDEDLRDARLERLDGGAELRLHPAGHRGRGEEGPRGARVELLDDVAVRVPHPFHVGEEDELPCAQRRRKGRGGRIGVHVQEGPFPAEGDRRDERQEPGGQDRRQERRVAPDDAADEPEVDPLDRLVELGPERVAVGAREPRDADAAGAQLGDERLVHEPREDRDDDVERLGVGDAQAALDLLRDVEGGEHRVDPLAAAVDDDRPLPGRPRRRDGLEGGVAELAVLEEAPPHLHDVDHREALRLRQAEDPVQILDRLGGGALEEVVDGGDDDRPPAAGQELPADVGTGRSDDVSQLGEAPRGEGPHERPTGVGVGVPLRRGPHRRPALRTRRESSRGSRGRREGGAGRT